MRLIYKDIRLIELFAGYGSQLMALKRLEKEGRCQVDSWLAVEKAPSVINTYNVVHGTDYPPIDISELKGEDLRIENTSSYIYI